MLFVGRLLVLDGLGIERSDDCAFANDLVQFRAVWRLDSLIGDVNALGVHQATATVMRSGPFRRSVVIGAVVTFHPCGWFQAAASGRTFLGEIEPRRSDDSGQVLNPAPRTIRLFR